MTERHHRRTLGTKFNEGARLLWLALAERRWSRERLAEQLGCNSGAVHRWLYGERKPGTSYATKLAALLAIPTDAWGRAPTAEFQPPGASHVAAHASLSALDAEERRVLTRALETMLGALRTEMSEVSSSTEAP